MNKHSLLAILLTVLITIGCFATACQPVATNAIDPTPTSTPTPVFSPEPTPLKKLSHIEQVGHVNKVMTTKTENVSIKFDADVKISDSKTYPIVELVPKKITQEQVDNFVNTFFPKPEHSTAWWLEEDKPLTKKEIKEQIKLREKWIADTKESIPKNAKGKSIYIPKWEKQIEHYKEFLKDAPNDESEIVLPDITKFAPRRLSNKLIINNPESYEWTLELAKKEEMNNTKHLDYSFSHKDNQNAYQRYQVSAYQSDRPQDNIFSFHAFYKDYHPIYNDTIDENYEDIPELETTYSEAKTIADKARNVLGLKGMDLYKSSIYKSDYAYKLGNIKYGKLFYYFVYTWDVEGTNVTYTSSNRSSYFYILIDDTGIVSAEYREPAEYKSTFPKEVEFMPFESIMSKACDTFDSEDYLYSRFIGDPTTHDLEIKNYNVVIEKIELGYMMVKGYGDDSKNYTLVPVWNFFGCEDYYYATSYYSSGETHNTKRSDKYCTNKSLLTINAINGQVIDISDNYWRN